MVINHYLIILLQMHQDFLIMLLLQLLTFHQDYQFYFYIRNNYNFMNIPKNIQNTLPNYWQNIHNIISNIYFFYNYKRMETLFKMTPINSLQIKVLQIVYFNIIIHQIMNNIMVVYTNKELEGDIDVKTFMVDMVVVGTLQHKANIMDSRDNCFCLDLHHLIDHHERIIFEMGIFYLVYRNHHQNL